MKILQASSAQRNERNAREGSISTHSAATSEAYDENTMSRTAPTRSESFNPTTGPRSTRLPWRRPPILLYGALAALCSALVIASLGGRAFLPEPSAQAGATVDGALTFNPDALSRGVVTDATHVRFVAMSDGWTPSAVRLAVKPNQGEPAPDKIGAQLLLDPSAAAALAGAPATVEVQVASLGVTRAVSMAVGLQGEGPTAWVSQPLPDGDATLRYDLPATNDAPRAIGFWFVSEKTDYAYGAEIKAVRVIPER
jgi:hypothetical protein